MFHWLFAIGYVVSDKKINIIFLVTLSGGRGGWALLGCLAGRRQGDAHHIAADHPRARERQDADPAIDLPSHG